MRLTIGRKMAFGFGIPLVLLAAVVAVTLINVLHMDADFSGVILHDAAILDNIHELASLVLQMEIDQRGFLLTQEEEYLATYSEDRDRFEEVLGETRAAMTDPAHLNLLDAIEGSVEEWEETASDPEIALVRSGSQGAVETGGLAALVGAESNQHLLDQISGDLSQLLTAREVLTDERFDDAARRSRTTRTVLIVFGALAVVFGGTVATFITRGITKPVRTLAAVSETVAQGDLTPDIEITTGDEVGQLCDAFRRMVSGLRRITARVAATSSEVSASSQQLSAAAQQTNASVQQVSSSIQQLAKGARSQAERVEETNRAMEQLNVAITQTADSAQNAASASSEASRLAQQGVKVVREAISTMDRIAGSTGVTSEAVTKLGRRSEQMAAIVEAITGVADQTNLLALNAAIEAARAGEAGRGFAVVAEEVRKLAENSAKSAAQIAQLIRETTVETEAAVGNMDDTAREVSSGKEMMASARTALDEILSSAENVATMLQQISAAAQQMSANAQQVIRSVEDVATVAEEASASTEEASASTEQMVATMQEMAASAQSLAQMGVELNDMVAGFKLGDTKRAETEAPAPPAPSKTTQAARSMAERLAEARRKMKNADSESDPRTGRK